MWRDQLALLPAPLAGGGIDTAALEFQAIEELEPGDRWREAFEAMWPSYQPWYLKEGEGARPGLSDCVRMLDRWMPELMPTFERLVELAGDDPLAARFLSMYRPPAFVVGCSQLAFTGDGEPVLVRNYDYPATRLEGLVFSTAWTGRRVIGMSDCLWGLLDGVNDAGLAVSLTFGGRPVVGDGFGIPLVIRYVLETCSTVAEACAVLQRIPVHAAQNVTALDREGDFATVLLSPDREALLLNVPAATNHQRHDDWPAYAAAVGTFEREHHLLELARTPGMTTEALVAAFLEPPLYRRAVDTVWGTLYTAAYYPAAGRAEYRWPDYAITQPFVGFSEQRHLEHYGVVNPVKL